MAKALGVGYFYLLRYSNKSANIVYVSRGGAAWSARVAHNHKVAGSNPAPATKKDFSETGRSFLVATTL